MRFITSVFDYNFTNKIIIYKTFEFFFLYKTKILEKTLFCSIYSICSIPDLICLKCHNKCILRIQYIYVLMDLYLDVIFSTSLKYTENDCNDFI